VAPPGILIVHSFAKAAGVYHAAFSPSRSVLMSVERESAVAFRCASAIDSVLSVNAVILTEFAVESLGLLRRE